MRYSSLPKDAPQPQARANENQRATNLTDMPQSKNFYAKVLIPSLIGAGLVTYYLMMSGAKSAVTEGNVGLNKEQTAQKTASEQEKQYDHASRVAEQQKVHREGGGIPSAKDGR
ncbi:hypothetical protein CC85DRAFT_289074 [Cutaneotrichosporon oleaginosum]|uniref:Uncharacterized protein n=1 Tax=Cutaneotrichosporon oleaginosum TaxID=879819 RepID=A0A0J0XCV4_9TREE|nr:uncharacterized protein CC85DRAFT_289074 [Cutaneotrichosporon oleaginosum]KLT38888.1 hypothetical protein CC85DRAFT_289074 [Cutaneotrichosporon oleaginosum]TXT10369.1 hypothetical protein COLE_04303 [Cutaneotrichosporon oleaginosum]